MSHRLDKLRGQLEEKGLDAILVSTLENRRYLSGFTGSAGYLFIARETAALITDFRYTEQATGQAPDFQIVKMGSDWSWLMELIDGTVPQKLGFESQHMTVDTYHQLAKALGQRSNGVKPSLVATTGLVERLRCVKDAGELTLLQRAIDVADRAMETVCPTIKEGDTEREVAWRMEQAFREFGAEGPSFDTIVAAGPNGAMPHHRPSDRPIKTGEPVVIDMGAVVDGYCSDITRTICLGEPDETFNKIYDTVLGAQLTAINTARPSMSAGDTDGLARTVIGEAGYGDNFGHSLGHGIGLAVHEYPRVGPNAEEPMLEGMVFSVEPGIYITDWGGVRIEDLVVMEKEGVRVLNKAPK